MQKDSRRDRTSIATIPPVITPYDKHLNGVKMGPGVNLTSRTPGEFKFINPPPYDRGALEIEQSVKDEVANRFGLISPAVPDKKTMLYQNDLVASVSNYLLDGLRQTLQLCQQYMTDQELQQVTGINQGSRSITKESIEGSVDITLKLDMRELSDDNMKYIIAKTQTLKEILGLDNTGQYNQAELSTAMLETLDPSLADRIDLDQESATAKEIEEEKEAFTQIAAGLEPSMSINGWNYQLRAQVLQEIIMQENIQPRLQQDEAFKAIVQKRLTFFKHQLEQRQNAEIGRLGVTPSNLQGQG